MATAIDANLIARVQDSAKKLGVAATWAKTGHPVSVEDDFLYEMYILFELISALQHKYTVKYYSGSGDFLHMFPRKPANKKNRPRFEVYDSKNNRILQVCAGTKIKDIHDCQHSPDISVQDGSSSDDPNFTNIVFIWDAKFRKDCASRISNSEVSVFGRWLELFNLRGKSIDLVELHDLHQLHGNCLITNGDFSTELDVERKRLSIKEVSNFYPKMTFNVKP